MIHPLLRGHIAALSNWGRWGADDQLGTVNLITDGKRVSAAALVRKGSAFGLGLPLDRLGPQPLGDRRYNPLHHMLATGVDVRLGVQDGAICPGTGYADDALSLPLQSSTQWDGLSHFFHNYRMYNDRPAELVGSDGASANSIAALGPRVATRGVLLDLARAAGVDALPPGHEITAAELIACCDSQGISIEAGDAVLLRTGHLQAIRATGSWSGLVYGPEPGPGIDALTWMRESDIAAAAADNWAFEVLPQKIDAPMPLHVLGIVYMGLLIGELFDLETLASDCHADGEYDFMFIAPPLPVTGAVGSVVQPIALK